MLAYNLLLLLIIILGFGLCEIKKSKRNNAIFLLIVSVAMIVMSYLRADTVGIDYIQYADYFKQVRNGGWSFLISNANMYRVEPGYSLFNYFVSLFTDDVHIFMLFVSILTVGLTAVLLYKYSPVPWVGMFVFASFGFFGNSLSFLRQSIAIAIFLYAINFLKKKKLIPYILIILLAASFHKAIIIMIPVYFLAHIKVNWKSLTAYASLAALILVLSWPLFNFVTKYVYQYYATQEGLYYMLGRDWQTAAIPAITTVTILIVKNTILKRDEANIVLINFSVYSGLLYIMTCQHFLFQRFGMMFFTSAILLIPELLASVGVESVQADVPATESLKAYKNKAQKKKALQERRQTQIKINTHKYIYYYATAAVLFVGFLYNTWILIQNRINLIPYVTFLTKK
ncbi:EpsG family protein [Caproiciproducens galactitolivorans]|uniref:Transmembrane protein EpsG n=1 Tax=Caproiciproducens galactitolivorans TaxID=642589 RepID=A0A4Z0YK65_9FIRM|nr:EpsG family protein [Caproiciproducens galactitolivorans]QEY35540.1 EpsG family protein [Caproiciproducens galactitolivorans]TGJ77262.1 transmembrane protein EpsG [Caproiciproducens galactitolivorans]